MKKSEKRIRQLKLSIRLTQAEKDKYLRRCNETGLSTGDYFRLKCLDEPPLRRVRRITTNKAELLRVRHELNRIGNNLNQAVRKLHGGVNNGDDIVAMSLKIGELTDHIRKALGYDS